MTTIDPERAEFITALRDLAAYLTDHPGVPVPAHGDEIHVFAPDGTDAEERAYVDQAAGVLRVPVAERNGHYRASRAFGSLTYTVVTISTAARAEHQARQSYCANITTAAAPAPAVTAA